MYPVSENEISSTPAATAPSNTNVNDSTIPSDAFWLKKYQSPNKIMMFVRFLKMVTSATARYCRLQEWQAKDSGGAEVSKCRKSNAARAHTS